MGRVQVVLVVQVVPHGGVSMIGMRHPPMPAEDGSLTELYDPRLPRRLLLPGSMMRQMRNIRQIRKLGRIGKIGKIGKRRRRRVLPGSWTSASARQ